MGKTLGKSNPNLTPDQKNPKILELVVLVHSLYLDIGEGSEAKIFIGQRKVRAEHCVNQGDMIPPIQGSSLSQDSSLNRTPRENCYISGYEGPNEIS